MASLFKRPDGGAWSIQFEDRDGRRRTVSLGGLPAAAARTVAAHVEHLIGCSISSSAPPMETARWLATIGDGLHSKLSAAGLVAPRTGVELGAFADQYRATRTDWRTGTAAQFGLAVKDAKAFFGADRRLDRITAADGDAFAAYLGGRLALATAKKRVKIIKHLLRAAVRAKLIGDNPLADQRTHAGGNRDRMEYVDPATANKVADELVGEPRLIFLLARYAGLRIVSEVDALRWEHVDFERDRLRIHAVKTSTTRTIPLLPIVRDALLAAFNQAPVGAEFVLQHRRPLPVLRKTVERAIVRAGVKAWPKVFQQLRASFATDAVRNLPANAAAGILGHGAKVAAEHYWMFDDSDLTSAAYALRNLTEQPRTERNANSSECSEVLNSTELDGTTRKSTLGPAGFESARVTTSGDKDLQRPTESSAAPGAAPDRAHTVADTPAGPDADPLLRELLAGWSRLPTATRERILGIARHVLTADTRKGG